MKRLKKIISVVMAGIMIFTIGMLGASAASSAPVFQVEVTSQTSTTVTVKFSVVSGSFSSLDSGFIHSSNIKECASVVRSKSFTDLKNQYDDEGVLFIESANAKTTKFAIASTKSISGPLDLYIYTFTKNSAKDIVAGDIVLGGISCSDTVNGSNINYDDSLKVINLLGSISFSQDNISMNYKASTKLEVESSLSAENIVWSSSNEKVATVDENGNVYASGKGTAVITAESKDGSISDTCNVTVKYSVIQWIIMILLLGFLWY